MSKCLFIFMDEILTIGQRLRKWGVGRYGSVKNFADKLDIVSEGLSPYLNDKRIPGNKMQSKLRNLGCDITWLITGQKQEEINRKFDAKVESLIQKGLTSDDYNMLTMLHGFKIKDTVALAKYLNWAEIKKDADAHNKKVDERIKKQVR